MDYEKAYKAVLQTAKQWIKDGCTDKEKICLECVFPELRESEDERIKIVNTEGDFGRGYDCGYQAGYAVAMKKRLTSGLLGSNPSVLLGNHPRSNLMR